MLNYPKESVIKVILHQLANESQERVLQYTRLSVMHPEGCTIGGILGSHNVTVQELILAQKEATASLRDAASNYIPLPGLPSKPDVEE